MSLRKLLAAAGAVAVVGGLATLVAPAAEADANIVEQAVADSTVRADAPDSKIWGLEYLRTEAESPVRQAYIKFDVSDIPAGDTVVSATLTVHGLTSGPGNISASSTTNNWLENGITWNNKPPVGPQLDSTPYGNTVDLDVSSAVAANGEVSFVVTTDQTGFRDIGARENSMAGLRPTLTVVTDTPVVEPPPDTGGGSGIALGTIRNRYQVDAGTTWTQKNERQEAQFGPFEGHWRYYMPTGSSGQLNAEHIAAMNAGHHLFINWKPWSTNWEQVALGQRDAVITAAADSWAANCDPEDDCWITFGHEPENDLTSTNTASEHRGMFQRAADIFHARAPEVKVVWTMMGFAGHREHYAELWPGADRVDIIGHDPYIRCGGSPPALAEQVVEVSNWFRANMPGAAEKPVVIAEIGADLGGNQALCNNGGDRGTVQHRADAINGVTARLDEAVAAGVVEIDYYDDGSDWISCTGGPTCAPDAMALNDLKIATEAEPAPPVVLPTTEPTVTCQAAA